MKLEVIYYKKCLCCGNIAEFIMRSGNTNTDIEDKDVYLMISSSCEPENRIRTNWCEKCNMHTKQEEIAWDYVENETATPPEDIVEEKE